MGYEGVDVLCPVSFDTPVDESRLSSTRLLVLARGGGANGEVTSHPLGCRPLIHWVFWNAVEHSDLYDILRQGRMRTFLPVVYLSLVVLGA